MLEKMQREEVAIAGLVRHFKSTERGTWDVRRGPDPPDFVLSTPTGAAQMGVEHTTLIWPSREIEWVRALNRILREVADKIADRVTGLFALDIQHGDVNELSRAAKELSQLKRRRHAIGWLAEEVVTGVDDLRLGRPLVLDGPVKGILTQVTHEGACNIRVSRMLSRGDDLGYSLAVDLCTGQVKASRTEQQHGLLEHLQLILERKAERLRAWQMGPKILLIDDWSAGRGNLVWLAKFVVVPKELDEVYIYSLRDRAMFELSELEHASR